MAVSQVGTPPSAVFSSTSATSPTLVWGTGQTRTAGDLLVLVVTASATTSVTTPSAPSGWTSVFAEGNTTTAHAFVGCYYKVATGGDAVPSIPVTFSGTGRVGASLFELAGVNTSSPIDRTGVYASGSSSATIASISVATSAAIQNAGEFAIAAYARNQATAAAATFTPPTGFTNLTWDSTTSTADHGAVAYSSSAPASGSTLTAAETVTSAATSYAAAGIVSFAPAAVSVTLADRGGSMDSMLPPVYVVQNSLGSGGSPGSFANPVAAGNTVVIIAGGYNSSASVMSTSAPTLGGTTPSNAQHLFDAPAAYDSSAGQGQIAAMWMLPNVSGGQTAFGLSITNGSFIELAALEIAGLGANPVADVTALFGSVAAAGSSVQAGPTAPTSYGNGIALAATASYGGYSGAPTQTYWNVTDNGTHQAYGWAYQRFPLGDVYEWTQATSGASAAGVVSIAATPNPKISTFQDNCATNQLSTLWDESYGTVSEGGGQISIQCDTSYSSALQSTGTFDLTNSSVYLMVTPYQAASAQTMVNLTDASLNAFQYGYSGGDLTAVLCYPYGTYDVFGSITYNPTSHAWLRVREAAGTVYFDTAPDGVTWTNQFSFSSEPFDLTARNLTVTAGDFGSDATGTSHVSNFNTPPATGITVTAAQAGSYTETGASLAVKVLAGAAATQNGATAASDTTAVPNISITPTTTGSWVYGAINAYYSGFPPYTVSANTVFFLNQPDAGDESVYGLVRSAGYMTAGTPVSIGGSGPAGSSGDFFMSMAEILPASGQVLEEDSSSPAPVWSNAGTSVTTAQFSPPPGSLLVALVSMNTTGSGDDTIAMSNTGTALTWTQMETDPALGIAAVFIAQVPTNTSTPVTESDAAGANATLALGAVVPVADAAGASDAITTTVTGNTVSVADRAGSADAVTATASVPVADLAGSADSVTVTVAASVSDAAGSGDALAVPTQTRSIADTAGSADAESTAASAPLPDLAGSSDTLSAASSGTLADAAGASDSIVVALAGSTASVADIAGSDDKLTVTVTAAVADLAASHDALLLTGNSFQLQDAAASDDALLLTGKNLQFQDDAGAGEALDVAGSGSADLTDAAGAADALAITAKTLTVPDSAAGADALAASATVPAADIAGSADRVTAAVTLAVSDHAGGTDAIVVFDSGQQVNLADRAAARDSIIVDYGTQTLTLSVGVGCDVYVGLEISVAIGCDVGGVYQAGIRSLATDRWYAMYPYSKGAS